MTRYLVNRYRFMCDGCGRLAVVEAHDDDTPRNPIGWIHFTGPHSGRTRHYCGACAAEKGLKGERADSLPAP